MSRRTGFWRWLWNGTEERLGDLKNSFQENAGIWGFVVLVFGGLIGITFSPVVALAVLHIKYEAFLLYLLFVPWALTVLYVVYRWEEA